MSIARKSEWFAYSNDLHEDKEEVIAALQGYEDHIDRLHKSIAAIEAELNALRAAAAPFVEAFNDTHAHGYRDANEEFTIFLDRNTITPSVKVGDFRRLAIAAKEA